MHLLSAALKNNMKAELCLDGMYGIVYQCYAQLTALTSAVSGMACDLHVSM
jgi:hypothetical protein